MAICKSCGVDILWIHRPISQGGKMLPYDEVRDLDLFYVLDNQVQDQPAMFVRRHRCDPEDVEQWEADAELKAMRWADSQRAHAETDAMRVKAYEIAMQRVCRKCEAPENVECRNLAKRYSDVPLGNRPRTRWPHIERMPNRSYQ